MPHTLMKKIIKNCACVFILSLFSINTNAQKSADDLGRLVFKSFKDKQLQSIDKYIITHSQLSDFLKQSNMTKEVLTEERYRMALGKFKEELDSIYRRGIRQGIGWNKIELISVESDINERVAITTILISYERYEIEIKFPLNIKQQGKWYLGLDISSDFTKYDDYKFNKIDSADSFKEPQTISLETGVYELSKDKNRFPRLLLGSTDSLYINPDKVISDSSVVKISYNKSKLGHGFSIKMELDEIGKARLTQLTEKNMFDRIAFIFNDNLIQAPTVLMKIDTGVLIFDGIHLDKPDVEMMVNQIKTQGSNRKN